MRSEGFLFDSKALDLLEGDIARGEVSHSYLFCGPRGIGAAELAERFATAVNCTGTRIGPLGYCGSCASCSKMIENVLVDYNVKRPTRAVRKERGAEVRSSRASIKIEDVREMIEDIYTKPNEAKRKFWVLEDVHTMEERMLNSLLKVLEEPPGDSIVVLTAQSPDDLLPTVVSRCKQVRMQRPSPEEVVSWLSSAKKISAADAKVIAKSADYLPGRAVVMAEERSYTALREAYLDALTEAALEEGIFAAQKAADKIQLMAAMTLEEGLSEGAGPADPDGETGRLASGGGIMEFTAAFLKDVAYVAMGLPEDAVENSDRMDQIARIAGKASPAGWIARAERAMALAVAVSENANLRLALDEELFLIAGDNYRKDAMIWSR